MMSEGTSLIQARSRAKTSGGFGKAASIGKLPGMKKSARMICIASLEIKAGHALIMEETCGHCMVTNISVPRIHYLAKTRVAAAACTMAYCVAGQ